MTGLTNMAMSVRQRLLNQARAEGRPFSELLQYHAMERFLRRLSESAHANRFVLKGALMLRVWQVSDARPTMDIDLLGYTSNDEAAIVAQFREVVAQPVEPDGFAFDSDSVTAERIVAGAEYAGVRVRFLGRLNTARITMQVDIGFGDIVHPGPQAIEIPSLPGLSPARMLGYSRESVVAEKLETAVRLGVINSRMKDFHDIWFLARHFDFDAADLLEALRQTFSRRGTHLDHHKIGLFDNQFASRKEQQWIAFRRRMRGAEVPDSFHDVMKEIEAFLEPITGIVANGGSALNIRWRAGKGWSNEEGEQVPT